MAVEAARLALRDRGRDAGAAALRDHRSRRTPTRPTRPRSTPRCGSPTTARAFDLGLSPRSALGGAAARARAATCPTLVVSADIRTGLRRERRGGRRRRRRRRVRRRERRAGPVVAELVGTASVTDEFVERWRAPGELRTKVWDEKFSEVTYVPLAVAAWNAALESAGLTANDVAARRRRRTGATRRPRSVGGKLDGVQVIDDLSTTVGIAGAAQPGLLLAALLEQAEPGQVRRARVVRPTAPTCSVPRHRRARGAPAARAPSPRRSPRAAPSRTASSSRGGACSPSSHRAAPKPQRVSATAAARNEDWKFGFVGSKERDTGVVHLPPARVSRDGAHTDEMEPVPLADTQGTIATFTVDRIAYSPSPPIVFAVVDFDGGGRLPVELTDADASEVEIGKRVEMTFRRLFTADGIANYFWKGRLVRDG